MTRSSRLAVIVACATGLVVAACSSSKSDPATHGSSRPGAPSGATAASALQVAIQRVAQAEKGTNHQVDLTPRPAVKGKHIVVISGGQNSISSQTPSDGTAAAAKALGWQVDLYDEKSNPASGAPLIRQAIASGADGIIVDATDCQQIQAPLQEAKAKGILVVGMYSFDCNDAKGGGGAQRLFSGQINFGAGTDQDHFFEAYGAAEANYIIAASHNTAKVIGIDAPEFTVVDWIYQGFKDAIAASKGSQIVDTLNVTTSDLPGGLIVGKIQAEILHHPEATWIRSPFTFATTIGVIPALGSKAGQINVMGGEGFQPELDLLRQGKITAVNILDSEWMGWAAADTMNSLFAHQTPVDSGIGWTIADKDHNLPASGSFQSPVNFKAEYEKAWGVSG